MPHWLAMEALSHELAPQSVDIALWRGEWIRSQSHASRFHIPVNIGNESSRKGVLRLFSNTALQYLETEYQPLFMAPARFSPSYELLMRLKATAKVAPTRLFSLYTLLMRLKGTGKVRINCTCQVATIKFSMLCFCPQLHSSSL